MKVSLVSLGCPKNLVDSEIILGILEKKGYRITNEEDADIIIVNTCSFIKEARKESEEVIKNFIKKKDKKLIVAGCLVEYYKENILKKFKGIHGILGVPKNIYNFYTPRILTTPQWTTYIKIADGCNNNCSYCIIPKLRGKYRSRKIEDIIYEVKNLTEIGVREINLISQDTTFYGKDLYNRYKIVDLLSELVKIKKLKWIRILYTHPKHLQDEFFEIMRKEEKICKYIDLPLQHIDKNILKLMRRPQMDYLELIKKIRKKVPQITIRTSFIVGFPGETETIFKNLLSFVKEARFEKLGAFIYSPEKQTPAYELKNQVENKIKERRYNELMQLQRNLSFEINKNLIGKEIEVLVEGENNSCFIGRTQRDAPDIDGVIFLNGRASIGEFTRAKITNAREYDLEGKII